MFDDEEFPEGNLEDALNQNDVFTRQAVKDGIQLVNDVFEDHIQELNDERRENFRDAERFADIVSRQGEAQTLHKEVIKAIQSHFRLDYDDDAIEF